MDRRQDPRTIVTPYAFSVHPDLLGIPLATPLQRLGAIAVDGVVIMGLTRIGGFSLAAATSLLLLWLAFRGPGRNAVGKLFRFSVGCMGLMVAVITAIVFISDVLLSDPDTRAALVGEIESRVADATPAGDLGDEEMDISDFLSAVPDIFSLQNVEDPEEARALMVELAQTGRSAGLSLEEIRTALEGFIPEDAPWSDNGQELVNEAMASLRASLPERGEPNAESAEASIAITDPVALDSIENLNGLVQELDEGRRDVERELAQARARIAEEEEGGLLAWFTNLLDELGLGFGWGALYLTITHALMKGSSIGKKLFRIRVVMIDLRPLGWWLSFERVGGYAAGLATGLLGFAQIFWDPNRQAIHDKVSETIVIQVGKDPVPGPWMAEGRAQQDHLRASGL